MLTFIVMTNTSLLSNECYDLVTLNEANDLVESRRESLEADDFLEGNGSPVFFLDSNLILLIHSKWGGKGYGIVFHDMTCFEEIKAKGEFPEVDSMVSIFRREHVRLMNIDKPQTIDDIFMHLQNKLNAPKDNSDRKVILEHWAKRVGQMDEKDLLFLAILIAEQVRIERGYEWIVFKTYRDDLNACYIPELYDKHKKQKSGDIIVRIGNDLVEGSWSWRTTQGYKDGHELYGLHDFVDSLCTKIGSNMYEVRGMGEIFSKSGYGKKIVNLNNTLNDKDVMDFLNKMK